MIREGNGLPIAWSILSGSLCIVRREGLHEGRAIRRWG